MGGRVKKEQEEFLLAIKRVATPLPGSIPSPILYRLPVKMRYQGFNIIDYLSEVLPKVDQDVWCEKIEKGKLWVNQKQARINTVLLGGNVIEHHSEPIIEPDIDLNIRLVYQDENILVLNKPAPLPMHPCGRFNKNSLTEILRNAFPKENLKLLHRIDANTTGLIVLAKNKTAFEIARQFENKTVVKQYLALVEGIPEINAFSSKDLISSEKSNVGMRKTSSYGQEAHTEFEVLERRTDSNTSLLKIIPHTGRTNQIRVHLAELGYPIVGDIGYKNPTYFKTNPLTYAEDTLCLHAWKLGFKSQGKELLFETELPPKLN